jgi:hypothetical protein
MASEMAVTSMDPRAFLEKILASAGCRHQWKRLPEADRIVCAGCGLFAHQLPQKKFRRA